jgi:PAS domain S-box-containing protein
MEPINVPDSDRLSLSESFLFENSALPKWIYDVDSLQFLAANQAALAQYGYTKEELLNMNLLDVRPKEDVHFVKPILQMQQKTGKGKSGVFRHLTKKGSIIYVEVHFYPILFEGKNAMLAICLDISEIVNAETRSLPQAVSMLKPNTLDENMLQHFDEFIWAQDIDSNLITFTNKNAEKIFGYIEQELFIENKYTLTPILHPEDAATVAKHHQDITNNLYNNLYFEYRIVDKSGLIRHISTSLIVNKPISGRATTIIGCSRNITDRVNAANLVKEKADEVNNILNTIHDLYYTLDKEWKYTYANIPFMNTMKKNKEELIGCSIWEIFPYLQNMPIYEKYHEAVKEQKIVSFEEYSDVLGIWMYITAYPTENGLTVCITNITEKKLYLQKIEAQNKQLMEIAWIQSHKMRAKVANILGLGQLFNTEDLTDPANDFIVKGMIQASTEMDEIIHEINNKTETLSQYYFSHNL